MCACACLFSCFHLKLACINATVLESVTIFLAAGMSTRFACALATS